jgi:hypothetical protein
MVGMSDGEQATGVEEAAAKRRLRSGFRCSVAFSGSVAGRNAVRRDEGHDQFEM